MSRFDYRDPGTDSAYCDGLDEFLDEARTVRRVDTTETRRVVERDLVMRADPQCPVCHGEGVVSYTTQQQHSGYVDVACLCTERPTTEHGV